MAQPSQQWEVTRDVVHGRDLGREVFEAAVRQLVSIPEGTTMVCDFGRVRILDFSAADEFLTNLIRRTVSGETGRRRVVLSGLPTEVREAFAAALRLRGLQCLEISARGKLEVLGELSAPLRQTLSFLNDRGTATVREVAESAGLELTAAANRLSTLARAGLIVRSPELGTRQGRQFVYDSIAPIPTTASEGPSKAGAHRRLTRRRGKPL